MFICSSINGTSYSVQVEFSNNYEENVSSLINMCRTQSILSSVAKMAVWEIHY